jgi:hypothetical protein
MGSRRADVERLMVDDEQPWPTKEILVRDARANSVTPVLDRRLCGSGESSRARVLGVWPQRILCVELVLRSVEGRLPFLFDLVD